MPRDLLSRGYHRDMSNRRYSLAAGTVLMIAAVGFIVMPSLLNYDAFIPLMLSLVCLFSAIAMFFRGLSDD